VVKLNAEVEAQPALAAEWKQSGKTWTFTIRDGVTFHDGTKLTGEAVVDSLTEAATVTTAVEDPLVPQRLISPQLWTLAAKAYKGKTVNPLGAGAGPFKLTTVNGTSSTALDGPARP
jgi:peptide/nickel transport system substrate-binding protein